MQIKLGIESPLDGWCRAYNVFINAISIGYFMFLEGFWIIVLYIYLFLNSKQK